MDNVVKILSGASGKLGLQNQSRTRKKASERQKGALKEALKKRALKEALKKKALKEAPKKKRKGLKKQNKKLNWKPKGKLKREAKKKAEEARLKAKRVVDSQRRNQEIAAMSSKEDAKAAKNQCSKVGYKGTHKVGRGP